MDQNAKPRAHGGGQGYRRRRPLQALRLLVDREACRPTGEMEQGEHQRAHRRGGGPAVGRQQPVKLGEASVVGQGPRGQVPHQHARHHDLIGGEAQEEGQQDDAVQAHQPAQGL